MAAIDEAKKKLQADAKETQAQLAYVQMQLEALEAQKKALREKLGQGEAAYQALVGLEAELKKEAGAQIAALCPPSPSLPGTDAP
jgi:septal ring factor EnvC (AmiA/AmiB activator)